MNPHIATLAGGCFWCLESAFNRLSGVEEAVSGYMGGAIDHPTYQQVCGGDSGHAEVVRVRFDPDRIGYRDLLEIFFALHDPTTLDRQGNDVGSQYRSAIFWHDPSQKAEAEGLIAELTALKALRPAHRHPGDGSHHLLAGGGLPPALLRPEPPPALLHVRGGPQAGQVPGKVRRATQTRRLSSIPSARAENGIGG
jgi:methionine-S-sulfoxide reductase